MKILTLFIFMVAFICCSPVQAKAEKVYKIGVFPESPMAMYKNGRYTGISIEIWRRIAAAENIHYKFVLVSDNSQEAVNLVEKNKIDGLIGAISVISARTRQVDFARPYFINRLGVITRGKASTFWSTVGNIIHSEFAYMLLIIIGFLFLFAFAIWYVEVRNSLERTDEGKRIGFFQVLYEATMVFVTCNPNDRVEKVKTARIRLFNVLAMFVSLTLISSFVGVITSALTINSSSLEPIRRYEIQSLLGKKVSVRKGSYANIVATDLGADVVETHDLSQAMQELKAGRVQSVLGNYLSLSSYMHQNPDDDFSPAPIVIGANEFAFAFPKNSPLLQKVNYRLVKMQERHDVHGICTKFLDGEESHDCII
jgi:polar amino acid transport system substrate-binding protein